MAENNDHGCRGVNEFVLGTLDDDSEEETDDEMEGGDKEENAYEEETLKEISVIKEELEKVTGEIHEIPIGEKEMCNKYAEYLLQTIIKLDNIDTKNNTNIREARKSTILYAQNSLQVLDSKQQPVSSNGERKKSLM